MAEDLFRHLLDNLINLRHPLAKLARLLPWKQLCAAVKRYEVEHSAPENRDLGEIFGPVVEGTGLECGPAPLPRLLLGCII